MSDLERLDDTDREILRLLVSDGRRAYRDIADRVDLSPPAVSDRVSRLRELGIIERFTVSIDRSRLRNGTALLIELRPRPTAVEAVRAGLAAAGATEHVFETAAGRVLATVRLGDRDVRRFLSEAVDLERVERYDVTPISDTIWSPGIGAPEFAPDCAECGNTVTSEGRARTIDGETYRFCCTSCADAFSDDYEYHRQRIDAGEDVDV